MNIILERVNEQSKDILYRLLQYSLYEESSHDGNRMNEQALFDYKWFDLYFCKENRDAFLIRRKDTGTLAGFVMINTWLQKSTTGHSIAEFMILPYERRNGFGTEAAKACFALYPGTWEVSPSFGSEEAYRFWKRVISQVSESCTYEDGLFLFTFTPEEN